MRKAVPAGTWPDGPLILNPPDGLVPRVGLFPIEPEIPLPTKVGRPTDPTNVGRVNV